MKKHTPVHVQMLRVKKNAIILKTELELDIMPWSNKETEKLKIYILGGTNMVRLSFYWIS